MAHYPKNVLITHFVNPSLFFCLDLSLAAEESTRTEEIEKQLAELAKTNVGIINYFYVPKAGDVSNQSKSQYICSMLCLSHIFFIEQMVAYNLYHSKKWIRCVVDYYAIMSNEPVAILWALDYGVPLHTSNFNNVFQLPMSVVFPESKIFTAGLGVLPARLRFDSSECKEKIEFTETWIQRSIDMFTNLLEDVNKRGVLLQFKPSSKSGGPNHYIGDLIVFENDIVSYGLSMKLVQADCALSIPDVEFPKYFARLDTRFIERWNDNFRTGGVLKKPEGVMKVLPLQVDNLAKLEMGSGVLPPDYLEAVKKKIENWQNNNDCSHSLISQSESVVPSSVTTVVGSKVEPPLEERPIMKKLEQISRDKLSRSKLDHYEVPKANNRNPIILPAGRSFGQSARPQSRRIYAKLDQRQIQSVASSLDDEEFISASQVRSNITNISQ